MRRRAGKRARRWRTALVLGLLAAGGALAAAAGEVPFAEPDLLTSSDVRGVGGADLDGDGDLDLLLPGYGAVRWLERDAGAAGGYVEHELVGYGSEYAPSAVAGDLDRDGDLDVVIFRRDWEADMHLDWLENDGTPGDGGWVSRNLESWTTDLFVDNFAPGGVALGDLDRDGDLDVVAVYADFGTQGGGDFDGRIKWYANDGSPANGGWSGHLIQDWWDLHQPVGARLADLDRDGDLDLVTGIAESQGLDGLRWYENDGSPDVGTWTRRGFESGIYFDVPEEDLTWRPEVGDPDRDGDLDVLYVTGGGAGTTLWILLYVNDGSPAAGEWPSTTVASYWESAGNHGRFADVDRDGWPDITAGDPPRWYENPRGAGAWTSHEVAAASSQEVDLVADLDRDGDPDLATALFSASRVENLEIHRSASLRDERGVNTLVDDAFDVAVGDLDGDGDPDLVSAAEANDHVYWHRSDGTPGDQSVWSLSTLSSAVDGPRAVAIGDLDGDGDLDVVVASYNDDSVSWLENDGTLSNWTKRVISAGAGGANDVALGDFDRDGDLDVACAQYLDNEISWYRNSGASPPTFGGFFVDSLPYDGPRALAVGDIDADGDLDLAAVSETTDRVVWYGNDGTPADAEWARHRTDNGESDGPKEVALADLDRDGDLDTLVANYVGGDFLWYENDGTLAGWTAHAITTCNGARGVAAGDFDGDGDLDALVSCFDEDRVKLQRSNGASPPDLATTVSSWVGANGARTVVAADLDRDGDLDGAVAQGVDDQIAWYENRGGQFRLSGVAAAGNPLYNDQLEAVLRATATHRGRAGDTALELAAVPVRLEESAGDPLNAFQAAALIDSVRLYGDDGDLLFEPASDPLVGSVSPAGIDGQGVVWIDLAPDQVAARVSAQQQKSFFVVLELAQPFGLFAAGTATLRAALVSSSPAPEAVDADFDLPLDAEWAADAPTALLVLLDVVFRDDLESGGLANWTSHLP